jgi:trans-aconitate methyltransferase
MPDSQKDNKWLEFYEITKNKPPSPLLVKAIKFVHEKDSALDLGAGALRDTKLLLQSGFQRVTSVDSEPVMIDVSKDLKDSRLNAINSTFNDLKYLSDSYDLINAQWSLPFKRLSQEKRSVYRSILWHK